jgi:hypothetical protein
MPYKDPEQRKKRQAEYYRENREAQLEYHRAYREANKEMINARQRASHQAHKAERNAKSKAYHEAHRDAMLEYKRRWREENIESVTEKAKEYRDTHREEISVRNKAWKEKHPERMRSLTSRFSVCRHRAKRFDLPFGLDLAQFDAISSQPCVWCGGWTNMDGDHPYSGLDRIDNDGGYTTGNCQPCCGICNRMRNRLTVDQFIDRMRLIISRLDGAIMEATDAAQS